MLALLSPRTADDRQGADHRHGPRRRPRQPHGRRRQGPADAFAACRWRCTPCSGSQPQVGETMINANRNLAAYESMGVPVWPDALPDYPGPLAGFLAGLERCETPYLVTCRATRRCFPEDLVERLADGVRRRRRRDRRSPRRAKDGELRAQPVFCLMRTTVHREPGPLHAAAASARSTRWTALHAHAAGRVRRRRRLRQRQHRSPSCSSCSAMAERRLSATLQEIASCVGGYDPKALPVAQAREFIARLVPRVQAVEKLRAALRPRPRARRTTSSRRSTCRRTTTRRWTATPCAAPTWRSTADDALEVAGTGFAGGRVDGARRPRPVRAHHDRRRHAGRASTPSCRRSSSRVDGDACIVPPGRRAPRRQPAPRRRRPGARRRSRSPPAGSLRPADLGVLASLGRAEVPVFRRLRVAFFSTGDELRSIGEPLDAGLRLRQQPLHALGDAAAARRRRARPGRRARRSGGARGRLSRRRRRGRRGDHHRAASASARPTTRSR